MDILAYSAFGVAFDKPAVLSQSEKWRSTDESERIANQPDTGDGGKNKELEEVEGTGACLGLQQGKQVTWASGGNNGDEEEGSQGDGCTAAPSKKTKNKVRYIVE